MISRRSFIHAVALLAVATWAWGSRPAAADDVGLREPLRQATDELNAWLAADGANGAAWRKYLELDALDAALMPGAQVDTAKMQRVLARFNSGFAGLDMPRFADVRRTLTPWLASCPTAPLASLPEAARKAKADFSITSDSNIVEARHALRDWIAALEHRLAGPSGEGWREYLLWDELHSLSEDVSPVDIPQLDRVRNRFRAARLLWHDATLDGAAAAFAAYARIARAYAEPQAEESYAQHLDELAKALESFIANGDESQLDAAAAAAGWLSERGMAPTLLREVRAHLASPNLLVQVSGDVLNREVGRPIHETYPVRTTISGSRVVGRGSLNGDLHLALVPNSSQGEFDLLMDGRSSSVTTSTQSRVTVRSRESTNLNGRKRVTLDAEGFHTQPADVHASTRINYTDVESRLKVFDGIAWRKVEAGKPQAQRESATRTRTSIEGRFDRETTTALDKLNHTFLDDFRRPLIEHGGTNEGLRFSTVDGRLVMNSLQATAFQLGPPTPPPPGSVPCDVWVRVHDSWVDRVSSGHLAGRTIAGGEFRQTLAESVGLPKPASKSEEPADNDWTITFADSQPLSVDVGDGRAVIVLRGREFTVEGKPPFPEMDITTPYRLEMTSQGLKLIREEPPKLYPPGFVPGSGQRLTGRQLAMRSAMSRVFEKVFEPEYFVSEIKPEGNQGRLGVLRLVQCDARQGWLNVALRQSQTQK